MKTTEEVEHHCNRIPLIQAYLQMRDHAKALEAEVERLKPRPAWVSVCCEAPLDGGEWFEPYYCTACKKNANGKEISVSLRTPLLNSTRNNERETPREPIGRDGVGDFLLRQAITHIAAEMAMTYGMPPTDPSDWDFDPATPHADRLKILEWARTSHSQCKTWSRKLKEIADPLVRKVEEMAGPIQDYQRSILAGLLSPRASESQRIAAGIADEKPDGQAENA